MFKNNCKSICSGCQIYKILTTTLIIFENYFYVSFFLTLCYHNKDILMTSCQLLRENLGGDLTHTYLVLTCVRYQDRQFLMWRLIQSPQRPLVVGFIIFIFRMRVSKVSGLGNLSPYSFSFSGWSNKSNDIQQINRKTNFNTCTRENHISM